MFEFQPATIEYILLVIFAASVLVQLFYYLIFYLRTGTSRPGERKSQNLPVSVIICARNEAENLEVFLPSVLEQDYPDFEVIVVNDCSDDDTEDILEKYARQYEKLKITKIYKESSLRHSKKMASSWVLRQPVMRYCFLPMPIASRYQKTGYQVLPLPLPNPLILYWATGAT